MLPERTIEDHSFLAEELLIPNADKTDGSRANMVCSQFSQLLVLDSAELPLVFTNFENQVGEYSTGIKIAKSDMQILKVFSFNDYRALILVEREGLLDLIEWKQAKNLTESFGFMSHIDSEFLKAGNTIEEGSVIYRNGMYDENANFQYGVNLRAVYLPYKGRTYEDPVVISKSAAEKLSHSSVHVFDIVLNRNDVLVQGGIPNIGEQVKNGILCNRRRINNSTILDEFKNSSFDQLQAGDMPFEAESGSIVTNIEVFCNTPEDLDMPYNAQLKAIEEAQRELYTSYLAFLNSKKVKNMQFSDEILFWKEKAEEYLNSEFKYKFDKREFEGIVVRVETLHSKACEVGSKLTGRYGNKGVVSCILPDEEMPETEDGRYAEIAMNSLGVVGRLNPSQLYEHELNFVAEEIRLRSLTKKNGFKQFVKDIMRFYEIACPEYSEYLSALDSSDMQQYLEEIWESGDILIHQAPFFGNAGICQLMDLYREFNIQKVKFKGIQDSLVFGKMYFIKLKHEAEKKFSARSTGLTSLLDVPYRTNERYKKGNALYNTNPVKFGEQEFFNMALLKNPRLQVKFLKCYSSSNTHRSAMLEELLVNDLSEIKKFTCADESTPSNSAQTVRALFRGIGVEIKHNDAEEDDA